MDICIFLAKSLGIYLTIMAVVMLVNANGIKLMINEMAGSQYAMFISGIISLIIGILIVVSHNIWEPNWRVLITIIGWLALIKGLLRLLVPNYCYKTNVKFAQNNIAYYLSAFIILVIGLYLSYAGFTG